jgi:hypothetical protein
MVAIASMEKARRTTLVGNLLLALASTAGFFAVVEFGAKLAGVGVGDGMLPNRVNCLRRSRLLGMEFSPDCHGRFSFATFDTNSLGLRDAEVRDDGAARILAMGDSCTWGWAVPQDASYPAVLERLLGERFGAGRYRVINAGTPGYTSLQGVLYLRQRGLPLRPAIVVLGYGFNDSSRLGDLEQQLARDRGLMPLPVASDFFLQHSRLFGWLRRRVRSPDSVDAPPA